MTLFVAARKGSQEKQKSSLKACDPVSAVTTLRQLAASILGPAAELEVGCVEGAAKLGSEVTTFNEADLEYTMQFVQD